MPEYEMILYDKVNRKGTITLNRPEKRNALNTQLFEEMLEALKDANRDPDVRVVVVTGAGKAFCAGQDLRFTYQQAMDAFQHYGEVNFQTREFIRRMDKPVIARVNGDAIGGGCYLATACDIIIAAANARFAMREILAGLQSGGAHLFTVGRQRSLEMNLTGRFVSAEEAERWNLINKVVPLEALDDAVNEMAETLADLPPLGIKYTKRATNVLLELAGFDTLRRFGEGVSDLLHSSEDRSEAQRAFLEKRKPSFKGR